MLVVQTFSGDNIRFNLYAVIGWGEYMYKIMKSEENSASASVGN